MDITINIDDWRDETLQAEEMPKNLDDLVSLALEQGYLSPQLFRMYAYCREAGIAEPDVLPDNKALLQTGGTNAIDRRFALYRKIIEINGKQFDGRAMVAPASKEDDLDDDESGDETVTTWQSTGTPEAADLAWRYLERRIPGHIWGRLLILADSGGDVRGAADMLHDKIDEMIDLIANGG